MRRKQYKLGRMILFVAMLCVFASSMMAAPLSQPITLVSGQKGIVEGCLIISETEAGMLNQGEYLIIGIEGFDDNTLDGIQFIKEPDVKVLEGDIEIDTSSIDYEKGYIKFKIKRDSTKASTIQITNFEMSVDRAAAEGDYDLILRGKAIMPDCPIEDYKIENFVRILSPHTQDLGNGSVLRGVTQFQLNSSTYWVNGHAKEMDGAAYVTEKGNIMIPVRYLADAFGIDPKNILFHDGVATIIGGKRTTYLKTGSDIALMNGVQNKLAEPIVVKDGRTYAPAAQIGNLLGVTPSWDDTSKTATFTNQAKK